LTMFFFFSPQNLFSADFGVLPCKSFFSTSRLPPGFVPCFFCALGFLAAASRPLFFVHLSLLPLFCGGPFYRSSRCSPPILQAVLPLKPSVRVFFLLVFPPTFFENSLSAIVRPILFFFRSTLKFHPPPMLLSFGMSLACGTFCLKGLSAAMAGCPYFNVQAAPSSAPKCRSTAPLSEPKIILSWACLFSPVLLHSRTCFSPRSPTQLCAGPFLRCSNISFPCVIPPPLHRFPAPSSNCPGFLLSVGVALFLLFWVWSLLFLSRSYNPHRPPAWALIPPAAFAIPFYLALPLSGRLRPSLCSSYPLCPIRVFGSGFLPCRLHV